MNLYQVQLQLGKKTTTENIYANDYKDVIEYYETLSSAEVIEVREWLVKKNVNVKDDGNYIHSVKIKATNELSRFSLTLPCIKKTLGDKKLKEMVFSDLSIANKPIKTADFTYTFS